VPLEYGEVNAPSISRKNSAADVLASRMVNLGRGYHLDRGVTLVLLQEGRYVYRASLRLPYIVLHPRIVDKGVQSWRAKESLANHVNVALSSFNP
jgi:hypothetical protein